MIAIWLLSYILVSFNFGSNLIVDKNDVQKINDIIAGKEEYTYYNPIFTYFMYGEDEKLFGYQDLSINVDYFIFNNYSCFISKIPCIYTIILDTLRSIN